MLDVGRLRVFREVAARGSISSAAEALDFTQPAVSRQVATLEREAGAQLLERTPRGVRLTEPGRVLLRHADTVIAQLQTAAEDVAAAARGDAGRLRIGAFATANASIVSRAIAAFTRSHPKVELSLSEGLSRAHIAALHDGSLDVAVLSDLVAFAGDPLLEVEPLLDDELLVLLPRTHPLARRRTVRARDFAHDAWIGPGEGEGLVGPVAREAGFVPDVRFHADNWIAKQGLTAAGVGLTLVPGLAVGTIGDDVVLRRLADRPSRTVVVARRAGAVNAAVAPFCAELQRAAEAHSVDTHAAVDAVLR